MIAKCCPKCKQQVPVACKACPCGHMFFLARRAVSIHKSGGQDDGEVKRRRTERVKREKPHYYDALEYDTQLKKLQRSRLHRTSVTSADDEAKREYDDDDNKIRKKRKRKMKREKKEELVEEEEDVMANITPEKEKQYGLVLSEINRKIFVTSWKA